MKKGTHPNDRPKTSISAHMGTTMGVQRSLTKAEVELPFSRKWKNLPKKEQDRLLRQATKESDRNKRRLAR